MLELLLPSLWETIYMVGISTILAILMGFPLGILLVITEKDNLWPKPRFNSVLNTIINILRSLPFIILMVIMIPITRVIIGTSIGTTAAIVPLSIAAAPFVARTTESSLKEVDGGVVEFGISSGAGTFEIISKIIIPEALPSIISGITLTIINLIGYSAIAGSLGGGGLGDLAVTYGYYRFQYDVLWAAVIVIILLVQGIQFLGNYLARKTNKK